MRRYLKILFRSKRKKDQNPEGENRRITARLPELNDGHFDEDGSAETVRQAAMERISKGRDQDEVQIREGDLKPVEFRVLREITYLHSDVEIP